MPWFINFTLNGEIIDNANAFLSLSFALCLWNNHTKLALVMHLNRNEEGIYYAIDLGGTNLRVLRVEVGAGSVIVNRKVEHQPIPEELTNGTTEVLV